MERMRRSSSLFSGWPAAIGVAPESAVKPPWDHRVSAHLRVLCHRVRDMQSSDLKITIGLVW